MALSSAAIRIAFIAIGTAAQIALTFNIDLTVISFGAGNKAIKYSESTALQLALISFANQSSTFLNSLAVVSNSTLHCAAVEPEKTASNGWRDVTLVDAAVSLFIVIVVRGEASTVV